MARVPGLLPQTPWEDGSPRLPKACGDERSAGPTGAAATAPLCRRGKPPPFKPRGTAANTKHACCHPNSADPASVSRALCHRRAAAANGCGRPQAHEERTGLDTPPVARSSGCSSLRGAWHRLRLTGGLCRGAALAAVQDAAAAAPRIQRAAVMGSSSVSRRPRVSSASKRAQPRCHAASTLRHRPGLSLPPSAASVPRATEAGPTLAARRERCSARRPPARDT